MLKSFLVSATLVVFLTQGAGAQAVLGQEQASLIGTVVAEATLLPLKDVLIRVEGTDLLTNTDEQGRFELEQIPSGEITVRVEHPGHVTLTEPLSVAPGEILLANFRLTSFAVALEAIVVRAMGDSTSSEQGAAEGAIDVPEDRFSLSAADLLEQTIPGLSVTPASGVAGGGISMRIRGIGSLTLSDAPSIYVDGVLVSGLASGSRGNVQALHVLQLIPADAVKRIRVLRGPAAAIRFPEAKNGVILVETRR